MYGLSGACTCVCELWICISRFSCGLFIFSPPQHVPLNLMGFILFLRRGMRVRFASTRGVSCHEPDFRSKQAVKISRRARVAFSLKCFLILTKTLSQDVQLRPDSCRIRYGGDITRSQAIEEKPTVIIVCLFVLKKKKSVSCLVGEASCSVVDSIANIPPGCNLSHGSHSADPVTFPI